MLQFNTSHFSYKGENRFDITYKANSIFSPTEYIVKAYKYGYMTQEKYTEEYLRLMQESYKNNLNEWQNILNQDHLVFVCYCRKTDFCHRFLLKKCFN